MGGPGRGCCINISPQKGDKDGALLDGPPKPFWLAAIQEFWPQGKWLVFACLVMLPFAVYNQEIVSVLKLWYVPIMGIIAASLPAAGAPIAGGIIFFPILTLNHICPKEAVAFAAATQFFGVGIFAPLNWLVADPSVFDAFFDIFGMAFPPAVLGLFASFILQISVEVDESVTESVFLGFTTLLVTYTAHGLYSERLNTAQSADGKALQKEGGEELPTKELPVQKIFPARMSSLTPTWGIYLWYSFLCFWGGMLTGFIGIGIEKLTFVLATWGASTMHVRSAGINSIVLVGWLSLVALIVHAATPECQGQRGYVGALPYKYWLVGLPGIFMGSILGKKINLLLGSKTVMNLFCVFLVLDMIESVLKLTGALKGLGECVPIARDRCGNVTFPELDSYNDLPTPSMLEAFTPWHDGHYSKGGSQHAMEAFAFFA